MDLSLQVPIIPPVASLYVGDLHPDITEPILFDKFSIVGEVVSVRVCRDIKTQKSLGYGYVNYRLSSDAERALDVLNFDTINGCMIRVMWSNRDPTLRKSGKGNIFIKNLESTIDNKELFDTFSSFGAVLSCKVVRNSDGSSRGYGFVHFQFEADAKRSIQVVNGSLMRGKQVTVAEFQSRSVRESEKGDARNQFCNVYVKNFGEVLTEDLLYQMFEPFGKITSSIIMRDDEGKSKGFGFVAYEAPESARSAVEKLNGKEIEGKQLYVGKAKSKEQRQFELKEKKDEWKQELENKSKGLNLYVKNFDSTFDDARLMREFSPFGTITSAKVMMNEDNTSKCFGFVCFSTPEEATKAVAEMNGRIIGGKPLYVALAQKKEHRRARLIAQHSRVATRLQVPPPVVVPQYAVPNNQLPIQHYMNRTVPQLRRTGRWQPQVLVTQAQVPIQSPVVYITPTVLSPNLQLNQTAVCQAISMPSPINLVRQTPTPDVQVNASTSSGVEQALARSQTPLTLAKLSKVTPSTQKNLLGERLYPLIERMQPNLAPKVTGMILEMDNSEILHMLENHKALKEKVDQAVDIWQKFEAKKAASN